MVSDGRMADIGDFARIRLVRMNGVGNAIVVADLRGTPLVPSAAAVRAIAAAPGLHFDQLMTIHDARAPETDAYLRIFNVDGTPSAACGNGTRCVAWVLLRGSPRDHLVIETAAGRLACRRVAPFEFAVDMGRPVFDWALIPLRSGADDHKGLDLHLDDPAVAALGRPYALSMGNPHAVFFVADTAALDLARLGLPVALAPAFPEGANVSFAQVLDRETIRLRVWERGAGATLGCGTGACATLVRRRRDRADGPPRRDRAPRRHADGRMARRRPCDHDRARRARARDHAGAGAARTRGVRRAA